MALEDPCHLGSEMATIRGMLNPDGAMAWR
jgi:hypothetical protein